VSLCFIVREITWATLIVRRACKNLPTRGREIEGFDRVGWRLGCSLEEVVDLKDGSRRLSATAINVSMDRHHSH
jgi:hypothetical protein